MTGNLGRVMKTRLCMVTGNGNGLLGMAVLSTPFGSGAAGTYKPTLAKILNFFHFPLKDADFQVGQNLA